MAVDWGSVVGMPQPSKQEEEAISSRCRTHSSRPKLAKKAKLLNQLWQSSAIFWHSFQLLSNSSSHKPLPSAACAASAVSSSLTTYKNSRSLVAPLQDFASHNVSFEPVLSLDTREYNIFPRPQDCVKLLTYSAVLILKKPFAGLYEHCAVKVHLVTFIKVFSF